MLVGMHINFVYDGALYAITNTLITDHAFEFWQMVPGLVYILMHIYNASWTELGSGLLVDTMNEYDTKECDYSLLVC